MKKIYTLLVILLSINTFAQIDEQSIDGTEQFGNAVATDGDWAVVGNMWHIGQLAGSNYPNAGMISIYKILPNGNWELLHNIDEPTYFGNGPQTPMGMYYGCSVDISGNNIIVGAYDYDSDMEGDIGPDGMAFIYSYDVGQNMFLKVATLAPELRVENSFGWSVAISGDWAIVGDPSEQHTINGEEDDRKNIGCAHVYEKAGGIWGHHTKLTASDGWGPNDLANSVGDYFGYSVDVDGDTFVIGAIYYGVENDAASGAAYIYEWTGAAWDESILQPMMPIVGSRFGSSVSILGNYMVAGAPAASAEGFVSVFQDTGNWGGGNTHFSSDMQAGDRFGASVSLSTDYLAVGAYGFDNETGKVYLYDYANGMMETSVQASDIAMGDEFGYSCSISDDNLIIGSPKTERDGDQQYEGTAYFYSMAEAFGGEWTGAINTDWGNPGNWADMNVPNGATDVVITALPANQPFIDNMIANCKNLTIEAGAVLSYKVGAGFLNVNGNLNNAGEIIPVAKSEKGSQFITVLGTTLFNGAGRQDIPGGYYEAFTFDAGDDSFLTGNVTFNGNYDHDSSDDLDVGANTLTVGGFLWGRSSRLNFSAESSLTIINDRVIDLELPAYIYELYDFTINVPGNHHVAMEGTIDVHNQLNLLDGDLYIGYGSLGATLELHNPINIVDGRLLPHKYGGDSDLYIYDSEKSKDVFHVPAELTTLDMFYISRSGSTVLDGDLHIESLFLLSTAGFDANGHQITYGAEAELWISGDAEISADMITGPDGIQELSISSGSPTLDFDGEVQGDFEIGAGAGSVTIAAGRCITVGGTTTVNSSLVLKSDATGTACFIDNGPITYGGKADAGINVERFVPSKEEWHYISSPVKNSTAQFFAGAYLNAYDTDNSNWVPFTSLDQAVNTMQGYSTKLPANFSGQIFSFSGELNTARTSAVSISLTDGGDAYNLVGNPFPSTIDWDHANWTKTNIANAVYIWNPTAGSYASYVAGAGVNGGSRYIAPMQGFFVEATGINPSLMIDDNDIRVDNSAIFLKNETEKINELAISLTGPIGTDEIMLRFMEEATPTFDANFDAHKMFGNTSLAQVYSVDINTDKLAINTLSSVKETEFVKLGLKIAETGIYSLQFNDYESFSEYVNITLEDLKTETSHILSSTDSYEFNYEVGEIEARFILHFKDYTAVNKVNTEEYFSYMIDNKLYVNLSNLNAFDAIQIYNMRGQLVKTQDLDRETMITINMQGLSKGAYIVKLISITEVKTQKFIH